MYRQNNRLKTRPSKLRITDVRAYASDLLSFFEPVVGQQTSRNIKAVISLFDKSKEGQNLFILAYDLRLNVGAMEGT